MASFWQKPEAQGPNAPQNLLTGGLPATRFKKAQERFIRCLIDPRRVAVLYLNICPVKHVWSPAGLPAAPLHQLQHWRLGIQVNMESESSDSFDREDLRCTLEQRPCRASTG